MAMGKIRDKSKEAFWRQTVRRQGQSGLTVRAFCREHELRETAFYFWPNLRSCASKSALAGAPGPFGGESFHYI